MNGSGIYHWYSMLIILQYTRLLESHYLYSCLAQSAGVMIDHHLLHFDTNLCQGYLQEKLTELQDFVVEANTVQAGTAQKTAIVQIIDIKA